MAEKSALVGMSGGVDSSVAAYLTLARGYRCGGATMCLHAPQDAPQSTQQVADAQGVAQKLGIPFYVLDYCEEFRRWVMEDFVRSYENGLTPNPCVMCNKHLKFGKFLEGAQALGYDAVVTGHYAQIRFDAGSGRWALEKAADESKDQSYFLYTLTQHQLAHTLFPLGVLTKQEAREIAQDQGFLNAQKRDSQDICFIPDGDYPAFLQRYTGKTYPEGAFLDSSGNPIGTHKGAVSYTLGQRKGLGLAMGQPVYVCGKDMQLNTVTVGPESALFHNALLAAELNWIAFDAPDAPMRVLAKTRSRQKEQPAWVYPQEDGGVKVVFDTPKRAITPGQSVVLYDGSTVIGGGTIVQAFDS